LGFFRYVRNVLVLKSIMTYLVVIIKLSEFIELLYEERHRERYINSEGEKERMSELSLMLAFELLPNVDHRGNET
jgi:hypothetical protein